MSQYNNKGMASDLSLGRPSTTSGSDSTHVIAAAAAARHDAYYMQQASDQAQQQKEYIENDAPEYESSNIITGLETYVRALQGEREKLDAFRRELPICMGLLDDAIHTSREKLSKAVASSRMVAYQTSYRNHGNPAEAFQSKGAAGGQRIWSREEAVAEANMYASWPGMASSNRPHAHAHAHAHASDDDHQFQKHMHQPSYFKDTLPNNQLTAPSHSMSMLSSHFPTSSHQLHFINYPPPFNTTSSASNMFLNKLQQKEGTVILNEENHEMNMRPQCRKLTEGFQNTREFSSTTNNEEEQNIMIARERNEMYEGRTQHNNINVHDEVEDEGASPTTLMISNMPNNMGAGGGGGGGGGSQTPRKARRCWSPELHQRFLHALRQLGGPQTATPKQIREVMHVEGLTNDEVKSHLQKFRLHTRRPAPIQASEPAQQPHHLVLFGGIWVPTSPAESTPAAQLAACHLAGGGHATSSGNHNAYVPYQHVAIGQNPMQAMMRAASSDQLDVHGGVETASEVDVARSDQSTSQNGGLENNVHEDEDTEIHLGSKPIISRDITSPIAKARYQ